MLAQGITNPVVGSFGHPGNDGGPLLSAIPKVITLGLLIGAVVFLFMLIIGAVQWMSSGGDKQALEGARNKISNALIGLVILFAVFAVLRLIGFFFGFSIMSLDIGPLVIQ